MAYIYVITNKVNGNQYVGKTQYSDPQKRFAEHIRESRQERSKDRPLYRAINKYGKNNFNFEVVEEVAIEDSCSREVFWINKLGTYRLKGYNATVGGDGAPYLDYDKIVADYKRLGEQELVAEINDCDPSSVALILKTKGVDIISSHDIIAEKYSKGVQMLDKDSNEVLNTFPSQIAAARFLIEKGYSKTAKPERLSSKISLVARGERKTCSGFKWERIK